MLRRVACCKVPFCFFFFLPLAPIPLIAILATDCCSPSLIFCLHSTHVLLACASFPLFFLFFLHSLSSSFFFPLCVFVSTSVFCSDSQLTVLFSFLCVYTVDCGFQFHFFFCVCVCFRVFTVALHFWFFFFLVFQTPHTGNSLSSLFFFFFFLPLFKWLCLFLYVRFFFLAEERKSLFFFFTKANSS